MSADESRAPRSDTPLWAFGVGMASRKGRVLARSTSTCYAAGQRGLWRKAPSCFGEGKIRGLPRDIAFKMDSVNTTEQGPVIGSIALTDQEREWTAGINWRLDSSFREDVRAVYHQNKPLIVPLVHSLLDRGGIPAVRKRFLTDPKLNIVQKNTSVIGTFRRNGCSGDEMIAHLHFLKYAWYLIHGARLSNAMKEEFLAAATHWLADLSTTTKKARELFREEVARGRLSRGEVDAIHEEFYKLALDCGLDDHLAFAVRKDVMRARLPVQRKMHY